MRTHLRRSSMLRREGHFLGALTGEAAAGLAIETFSTRSTDENDTGTGDLPSGTESDDLLVALIFRKDGDDETVSAPSGWTLIQEHDRNAARLASFVKVAGSSEPATYDFTTPTSTQAWHIAILRIPGADTGSPVNVSAEGDDNENSTMSSLTTTVDGCLILGVLGMDDTTLDEPTEPNGYTKLFYEVSDTSGGSSTSQTQATIAHKVQETAGSTGTAQWTHALNNAVWHHIAIAPA